MSNRNLVDAALEKTSQHEKEGNKEEAERFLRLTERAEEAYDKKEERRH